MNISRQEQLAQAINGFPEEVRKLLYRIPAKGGCVDRGDFEMIRHALQVDPAALLLRLVSLAQAYAVVPISRFCVGAVAQAKRLPDGSGGDVYLGANMEFEGLSLNQSIHAEQAAVANAWSNGETAFSALAVSASPCGLCRQFLHEYDGGGDMRVILPAPGGSGYCAHNLSVLMPDAFGPRDLGIGQTLEKAGGGTALVLYEKTTDPLVQQVLREAEQSYAPYTGNLAGCALETADGRIYFGRNMENAAYNPGMTPIHAATVCAGMNSASGLPGVRRVVLVEKETAAGQRRQTEQFVNAVFPGVGLEYHPAKRQRGDR